MKNIDPNIDHYLLQVMDNGKIEIDDTLFPGINIFAACGRENPRNYAITFYSDFSALACHIYISEILNSGKILDELEPYLNKCVTVNDLLLLNNKQLKY